MSEGTKLCRRCKRDLPAGAFSKNARYRDGLASYCKRCVVDYSREWAEANRERVRANQRARRAKDPQRYDAASKRWAARNRAKVNAMQKAWRQRHPDYHRSWLDRNPDYMREWEAANRPYSMRVARDPDLVRAGEKRRRARLLMVPTAVFTENQLRQRLSMFPGCWICGGAAEVIDHVKPLSKGGAHMLCNLRPACSVCNKRKAAKWPFDTRPHPARTFAISSAFCS